MHLSRRRVFMTMAGALSAWLGACAQSADPLPPPDAAVRTQPSTGTQPATSPRCSKQELTINRLHPTIWLAIDGSGSMNEPLSPADMTSRWSALRSTLFDPGAGIVSELEHAANWGLTLYDGPLPDGAGGDAISCPRLIHVEPRPDNLATLQTAFPEAPLGGSTPTDRALTALGERLSAPADTTEPRIVVLVTDGQPNDFCPTAAPAAEIQRKVVAAAAQLTAAGTQLYVVSLAAEDAALQSHLEQVAAAGGTGKAAFAPRTRAELAKTFETIFGPKPDCEIALSEPIDPGTECQGRVRVNDETVPCNDPDGYRLKSPDTLELTGRTCEAYKKARSVSVRAEFPCGGVP